jgi:hypothetical protein
MDTLRASHSASWLSNCTDSNNSSRNNFTDAYMCRTLATGKALAIRIHLMIGEEFLRACLEMPMSFLDHLFRQRADEKRRKKDEKEAKRYREDGRNDTDYDLRLARERDAQLAANRDRRKSFNTGTAGPPSSMSFTGVTGYPRQSGGSHATVYPSIPYSNAASLNPHGSYATGPSIHHRTPSSGTYHDITRQMDDLNLSRSKDHSERDRKTSSSGRSSRPGEATFEPQHIVSGNYVDRANPYPPPTGAYPPYSNSNPQASGVNPYPSLRYRDPSPNMHPSEIPFASSGYPGSAPSSSAYGASPARNPAEIGHYAAPFGGSVPVYPRGHVLEGQSIHNSPSRPPSRPPSRAASPNTGNFTHFD